MSINDWASKVAEQINVEYAPGRLLPSIDRIAAIIATSAKPLLDLLEPRQHYHCEDSWYCCGKCACGCPDDHDHDKTCYPSSHGGESPRKSGVCDCGADIYNMNLKTAFSGLPDSSRDNKQKHT